MKALAIGTLAVTLLAGPALAGLRSPQVAFNGTALQAYFTGLGQTINVYADQWDNQCWSTTVSGNSTFTVMLELAGFAPNNTVGIYNCAQPSPVMIPVFPGFAAPGWFAVVSFGVFGPGSVVVNLFDNNAVPQPQAVFGGIDQNNFGFYLQGPGGTFFSQDGRNGPAPQALVYPGTGTSAGQWWLAFEDLPYIPTESDFDDFVLFMESVNPPVPVQNTTWGGIKSLMLR